METRGQYPITLVTAYFELGGKPDYPELANPYPRWIRRFLPCVRWPLVIFCDERSVDMLKEARGDKPAVWHVTRPEKFYVYKYLDDLKRLQFPVERTEAFITRSLVWHEKHHFLRSALSENTFDSEMLFWSDIGQFRHNPRAPFRSIWRRIFCLFEDIEWPSLEVCRALPEDKVVLVDSEVCDAMGGAFFGGAVKPARRWCDAYYRHLERRKRNGAFTSREEYVMVSCWRRQPEFAHVISSRSSLLFRFPFRRTILGRVANGIF